MKKKKLTNSSNDFLAIIIYHNHMFSNKSYKVLMHLNTYYKLCIEIIREGSNFMEGDIFLLFEDKGMSRTVFGINNILRDCRAKLDFNTYLRVEKFFMERI